MCSCIHYRISVIVVRKVIAVLPGIKSKLQYFHTRKARILQHLPHRIRKESKILRNDRQLSQLLPQCPEQIHAGPRLPAAMLRCPISIGNGIVFIKSTKMVDPYHVIPLIAVLDPGGPPRVAAVPMYRPVIERVPPELPGLREGIRRAAGNTHRPALRVKLEELWMRPGIGTVQRHIDRDISDDPYAFFIGI